MRNLSILSLVALATCIVIPDEHVLGSLSIESNRGDLSALDGIPTKEDVVSKIHGMISNAVATSKEILDDAFAADTDASPQREGRVQCFNSMTAFDAQSWIKTASDNNPFNVFVGGEHSPDHRPNGDHDRHGKHGHHGKPNMTVYQLIAESKYTTKLAALINEDADLIRILNGTDSNYTVFAPIDSAFEKIPEHHKEPTKEMIKKVLLHHISPDFYPAGRVLVTHTVPTLLTVDTLGNKAQRLRFGLGLNGLTVDFYSRVIAINIFGTNGVIHGVDSIILPPFETLKILQLLPSEFSTLELGLRKTGLWDYFDATAAAGGTLFAPNNFAFRKLGPKINAFLFSSYGQRYLKAILKYHVISNATLYSDAYYPKVLTTTSTNIPKGQYHLDLPTLLDGKSLGVDIFRLGGYINMKVNGFSTVTTQDGVAKDGVIQIIGDVLVPPKTLGETSYNGEELTVEELRERIDLATDLELEL